MFGVYGEFSKYLINAPDYSVFRGHQKQIPPPTLSSYIGYVESKLLTEGYVGDYIGDYWGAIKGDARSLVYSSHCKQASCKLLSPKDLTLIYVVV